MDIIIYDKETKTFSRKFWRNLGYAGTAIGVASGALSIAKELDPRVKYGVVFKDNSGKAQYKTVKASHSAAAITKVKSSNLGSSKHKAFLLPKEDHAMNDYYNLLKN